MRSRHLQIWSPTLYVIGGQYENIEISYVILGWVVSSFKEGRLHNCSRGEAVGNWYVNLGHPFSRVTPEPGLQFHVNLKVGLCHIISLLNKTLFVWHQTDDVAYSDFEIGVKLEPWLRRYSGKRAPQIYIAISYSLLPPLKELTTHCSGIHLIGSVDLGSACHLYIITIFYKWPKFYLPDRILAG